MSQSTGSASDGYPRRAHHMVVAAGGNMISAAGWPPRSRVSRRTACQRGTGRRTLEAVTTSG